MRLSWLYLRTPGVIVYTAGVADGVNGVGRHVHMINVSKLSRDAFNRGIQTSAAVAIIYPSSLGRR